MSNRSIVFVSISAINLLSKKDNSGTGGAEKQLFLFGVGLKARSWQVSFITSKPKTGDTKGLILPAHFASFSYLGGPKWRVIFDWLSFWNAMLKANAYYYVLKVPEHLLMPMSLFCKIYKRKLIFWGQMTVDVYLYKRKGLSRIADLLRDWGLKRADIVIAQTDQQRKQFKDIYGIDARVVPSICDSAILHSPLATDLHANEKEVDILWVGNSMQKKQPLQKTTKPKT